MKSPTPTLYLLSLVALLGLATVTAARAEDDQAVEVPIDRIEEDTPESYVRERVPSKPLWYLGSEERWRNRVEGRSEKERESRWREKVREAKKRERELDREARKREVERNREERKRRKDEAREASKRRAERGRAGRESDGGREGRSRDEYNDRRGVPDRDRDRSHGGGGREPGPGDRGGSPRWRIVFDSERGVRIVVEQPGFFFDSGRFYRLSDQRWQVSVDGESGWTVIGRDRVPRSIRDAHRTWYTGKAG